ncbi:TIGR02444 family protein [Ectothiorhodospiraceae bacterium 2226]|nr:TIGR02444 family protein [Ectothiorhodospiraceae bacterium 2226]
MNSPSAAEAEADELAASFWDYSLDVYARPGVADSCLRLQDEAGLDVNLLLLCGWLAMRGRGSLDAAAARHLESAAAPWRHAVLAPLRAARRRLKPAAAHDARVAALRRRLAELELRAERVAQALLVRALPAVRLVPPRGRRADAAASLAAYAGAALAADERESLLNALTAGGD